MGAIIESGLVSTQKISKEEITAYADLTGDRNPIHLGDDPIAHGALLIGKVSMAVWMAFGDGTIARKIESFEIKRPIKANENFNIQVDRPTDYPESRLGEKIVKVRVTKYCDGNEKLVAEGTIVIIPPKNGNGILNGGGV